MALHGNIKLPKKISEKEFKNYELVTNLFQIDKKEVFKIQALRIIGVDFITPYSKMIILREIEKKIIYVKKLVGKKNV